jgi:hypothetical protein
MLTLANEAKIRKVQLLWPADLHLDPWTCFPSIEELDVSTSTQVYRHLPLFRCWFPNLKLLMIQNCNVKDEDLWSLERLNVNGNYHLMGQFPMAKQELHAMNVSKDLTIRLWQWFQEGSSLEILSADLTPTSIPNLIVGLQKNRRLHTLHLNCSLLQTKNIGLLWCALVQELRHVRQLRLSFSQVQTMAVTWKGPLIDLILRTCPETQL